MNKIIYLDSAASALKPESVIKTEMDFLRDSYANAGRGVCARAIAVDDKIANARKKVADFIGAKSPEQLVFTSGPTDGMHLMLRRSMEPDCATSLKIKII